MSVWTTLSESDTGELDIVPGARPGPLFTPSPPTDADLSMVAVATEPPAVAGRQALREARRKRQVTAAVCVVVVAVLLAISIMIVGIARDRPATPASSGAVATTGPIVSAPLL
ncbi:MAG: hypothetical protein QOJ44_689 [Acidimicrobiaceae bacterium]|jgi:hypothetical protein|nr:hypothetical protein [Acidimicrobiaceae bacterium]